MTTASSVASPSVLDAPALVCSPSETRIAPLAVVTGAQVWVPLVDERSVRYANLDYAASAPALQSVADRVVAALPLYSSVHRGAGYASHVSTAAYEAARRDAARFVGAREDDVVIFTRNTTDSLNLLAAAVPGPVVHLDIEHHANLLPWQRHASRVVTARPALSETVAALEQELRREPAALLAVTGASNVTGECLPLEQLATIAHRYGARLAVDGAQLVPHRRVDLSTTGIDYLAFSGHKLYAPFGAGALIGRRDWLDAAPPHLAGGGAVRNVTVAATSWADSPARHEAGTPNVLGALALAAAGRALAALPAGALAAHEASLLARLDDGLAGVGGLHVLRLWPGETDRIGVVTFVVDGIPAALVAQYLSAEHGIGVRDGRFCAHPLLARLNADDNAVRASLGIGSSSDDVDRLVEALTQLRRTGPSARWPTDRPLRAGRTPVPTAAIGPIQIPERFRRGCLPAPTDPARPAKATDPLGRLCPQIRIAASQRKHGYIANSEIPTRIANMCCRRPANNLFDRCPRWRQGQRRHSTTTAAGVRSRSFRVLNMKPCTRDIRSASGRGWYREGEPPTRPGISPHSLHPEIFTKVENQGPGVAISLHVYGADIARHGSSIRRSYSEELIAA